MFYELTRDDVFRIETRRLWLRWPTATDSEALHEIVGRREVAEMTASWPHPLPEGEAAHRIVQMRRANEDGLAIALALTRKVDPDVVIGCAGAFATEPRTLSLGYFLAFEHHGQGYMTEAIAAVVDAGFRMSLAREIRAACWSHNAASRRLLEKCGFDHLGARDVLAPVRSDGPQQAEQYALDRSTWLARQGAGRLAA
jgi:RimJ/RimL family protein N-acetyltransferase